MAQQPRERGRYSSLRRPLLVLSDLVEGKSHDRHSVSELVGVEVAGADRIIKALKTYVRGVVTEKEERVLKIKFVPSFLGEQPGYPLAIAACFGASLASLFEGTDYAAGMRNALRYVVSHSRRRKAFQDLDRKFFFVRQGGEQSLDDPAHAERFDEFVDALLHQRRVRMKYRGFEGRAKTYRVDPLSVAIYDHQLYAIGRTDKGEVRLFRVARIEALDSEQSKFVYPPRSEYDPRRLFQHSLGVFISDAYSVRDVVLRLSSRWINYVQSHRWHPSQEAIPDGDGVLLKLHVRLCPEVEQFVLSFGEQAEVLEPIELRKAVADRLAAAHRIYAGSSG